MFIECCYSSYCIICYILYGVFLMYFYDVLQNLSETKNATVSVIFLIDSFTSITVTDTLRYRVSQKADIELKISRNDIVSIDFS